MSEPLRSFPEAFAEAMLGNACMLRLRWIEKGSPTKIVFVRFPTKDSNLDGPRLVCNDGHIPQHYDEEDMKRYAPTTKDLFARDWVVWRL